MEDINSAAFLKIFGAHAVSDWLVSRSVSQSVSEPVSGSVSQYPTSEKLESDVEWLVIDTGMGKPAGFTWV